MGRLGNFLAVLLMTALAVLHPGLALNRNFLLKGECLCTQPDFRNLTYECTAVGPGITYWRGSALDCPERRSEIRLRHSLFSTPGRANGVCNNGNVTASGLGVENNGYTSQLHVVYSPDLLGSTIVCVYDNFTSTEVIGNATIAAITEPFPPPEKISLSNILPGPQLTFNWTSIATDCQEVEYLITSSDCGSCATSIADNTAACVNAPVDDHVCSFQVRTKVCGNIVGATSNSLSVKLKAPDAPSISQIVPSYSYETEQLAAIVTTFTESDSFNITDDVIGSATSYTVTYTDAGTGSICASQTVSPSSCQDGVCMHLFDLSTSNCIHSVPISISVSATNILGRGPLSTPLSVYDVNNSFISARIDLITTSVTCTFVNQEESSTKTCSVAFYQSSSCGLNELPPLSTKQSAQNASNTVTIGIPLNFINKLRSGDRKYCFIVSANNGTHAATVQGALNRGCNPNLLYDGRTPFSPDDAVRLCDPPLKSIAVEEGYACYIGSFVGAAAVHHCRGCGYRLVRVCMANGSWNGSVLQCNCPTTRMQSDGEPLELYIVLGLLVLLILTLLVLFALMWVIHTVKKRRTSEQVDLLQARVTELSTVYEDLDDNLETVNNRAYRQVEKSIKSVSEVDGYDVPRCKDDSV